LENGVVAQGSTKEGAIGKLEEAIGSLERVYRKDRNVCCRQISMKELQEFLTV
jgi:predicted RNase H-like HicB family nuclease